MEAIIKRLKRLKNDRHGVSNVLVVMLSLILITVIVANVVLWNYQMNQLDIERMRESINITNASRLTHSKWFTAQNEFSIIRGSKVSGTYTDTRAIDSFYESFKKEPQITHNYSYPSSFTLLGGTSHVSGSLSDLQSNNGAYMTFGSYAVNDEDFVDQQSDIDGSADIGAHSNFTAMQAGPDGVYDNLTEANTVGTSIPVYVGAGTGAGGIGNVVPTLPAGWQLNDIFLLFVESNSPVNAPSGWSAVSGFPISGGSTAPTSLSVFWKRATNSESNPTVTGGSNHKWAIILAFRGCIQSGEPWDAIATGINQIDNTVTTLSANGVTTTVPNTLIVVVGAHSRDNAGAHASGWSNPNLANPPITEAVDSGTTAGSGGGIFVAYGGKATAGATGPTNLTYASATVQTKLLATIALKPQPQFNYQLDLEVQWTNASYNRTYKELCIKTGALDSESLKVDVWNGSNWITVIEALTANSWNNVSVSNHLTSNIFTIRFKDAEISNDGTQSSWQIDCVLLHTWDDSYVQVELMGTSNTQSWSELVWTVDCSSVISSVNVTFQLYDYEADEYSTSGDGYITAIIGTIDITVNQTITANPTRFRDADGSWKIRIAGKGATPFNLKIDLIELKATSSNIYRLEISNLFTIDLSTYPLDHVYGIEIMVRYNVSEAAERWFIRAYDWASEIFSDAGFNFTEGDQPTPNEWNDYTISINKNWTRYLWGDGAIQIMFCDEGTGENQTFVCIDFVGVRVILNGIHVEIKNSGATTAHIVSLWVINATHHIRYDVNFFINSGESATYIRVDIPPPAGNFTVKIVTERGNIDTF
ncbi:MAG: hypothetical protein QXK47_00765 [Candidatus Bathyarchaeia archaeon]